MSPTHSSKRNSLLSLGSAAVIAVYTAGFVRTRGAAAAFASESADHRPAHVSLAVPEAKTPSQVTDSIAVAAITGALRAPASTGMAKAQPKSGGKRTPSGRRKKPTTPVVAKRREPVPTSSPAAPEPQPIVTPSAAEPAKPVEQPRGQYRDGLYRGYGTSRHGDIEAEVEIRDGRISVARISQCLTRYSCSWISELPGQVVARQSAEVDYVSGATQSSDAFYQAVVEALSKAK